MNSKQIQYATILARTCNFSLAAEELGITQPAFSKQIIALENELGIKLFDRSTTPLSLTAAGEFFISKAKKLLFEQENLLKTVEKYKSGDNGRLTVGIAPFRSLFVTPKLVKEIKKEFPGVHITLQEYGLDKLQKGLRDGLYDFAIMNLPVDEAVFDVITLEADSIVLAVPDSMTYMIEEKVKDGKIDFCDCEVLPFAVVGHNQEMRKLFDKLCLKAEIEPEIYVEVTSVTTAREMVRQGLAATLLPKEFLQGDRNNGVTVFELKQNEYVRQPAIVTLRNQYISQYAEYAIKKLTEK